MKTGRTIAVIKIISLAFLAVAAALLYPYLNPHDINQFVSQYRLLAPLIFILLCIIRPLLFFLPSMGLTVVAGVLFGSFLGTLYVATGGALSTVTGFFFARWLGRDAFKKLATVNKKIKHIDEWSIKHGGNAILSMRLFNLPWDMVSYWAGVSGIRFREFYIASLIPLLPVSFLYTYFGSKIFTPESPGFIISLSIMFLMGAAPYIKRRLAKRTKTDKPQTHIEGTKPTDTVQPLINAKGHEE